jgi:primosomal protein N' (replication factor Y)
VIAEVFVDIPASPVDRPFDYRIPDPLRDIVVPGMRVTVPFGRTRRLGFVTIVKSSSERSGLKAIEQVLDPGPVLTAELIDLGRWLSQTTLCPIVSAYQAMLPSVMKAGYGKFVAVADSTHLHAAYPQLSTFFAGKRAIGWNELMRKYPDLIRPMKKAIREGTLVVQRQIANRAKPKRIRSVSALVGKEKLHEALLACDARAARQREVLEFFLRAGEDASFPLTELTGHQLSRQAIGRLVEKKLLKMTEVQQFRTPAEGIGTVRTQPLPLTGEQRRALAPIIASVDQGANDIYLCHGVTGSGKTEIYLQAIGHVTALGKQAIVLVPEISLTPQMVHRFKARFGDRVAVMHSGLSSGEKYDEWRKIRDEKVNVAVGARSAVFAPFRRLGLIIIDEEHESSYKQEDMPRYHARDVAIWRAGRHGCPVVLGSATPSLESYARARKGVYQLLTLKERFNHHPLPPVQIVDMREEMRDGNHSMFSRKLFTALTERLRRHEQTVLFLNRRGFSTFVMCRSCGTVIKCPHCDISLTYHRSGNVLKCHYCGYRQPVPEICPSCGSDSMRYFGTGTQKVEAELNRLLPEARVIRMDVDTTRKKGGHERLLRRFGNHEADILLGTQMIAKGLDFPKVTLVGVLAADSMLHLPDFRASEKTFQLLTQVSGRAGRHDLPGAVVIQSYAPDHYAVIDAAQHDYLRFYREEMQIRYRHGYPPFYYIALIGITHPQVAIASETAKRIATILKNNLSAAAMILGPVVPPVARIKDRYRYQCMVKYKREPALLRVLGDIARHFQDPGKNGLRLSIDLNPVSLD